MIPQLEKEMWFVADSFEADNDGEGYICKFMRFAHNTPELSFHAKKFTRRLPNKKKKELAACQFARVTFTPGGRAYDYICELPDVEVGDKVVVFANGEEKEVEVTQVFKMSIADIPMAMEKYKKILRKA